MKQNTKPAMTRQAWLDALGRRLVWSFPAAQAKEVLSDFREQFDAGQARGRTEEEVIQALGTPAEAAALLLEEDPSARAAGLRKSGLWGAALAVCCAYLWMCLNTAVEMNAYWLGVALSLPLAASMLFQLVRGPARTALEGGLLSAKKPSAAAVWYVPAALVLLCGAEQSVLALVSSRLESQYRLSRIPDEVFQNTARALRYGKALFLLLLMLAAALLAAWMLLRSVNGSIRYFPGVVHALGAFDFLLFSHYFSGFTTWSRALDLLICLLPYGIHLATALVFRRWVDGRRPLPGFFQDGAAAWEDWRHRLGVDLLGWFSAEQALEVLEDYQEQYELGREQGKTEEALLAEMGRPEQVVGALLAEDRKARLRRRKTWFWWVLAAASGWLLLSLLRTYELGAVGFGWALSPGFTVQAGVIAAALGTASLFFLLHGRARAAVERRFPAPRTPSLWIWLLPPALSALVEGLSVWLIYASCTQEAPALWGLPLYVYIVSAIECSVMLLMFLLIWTLAQCVSGSIRYFHSLPHIAGSIALVLCAGIFLRGMDMEYIGRDLAGAIRSFLPSLYPYGAGALLAAASWPALHFAGRKKEG